MGVTSSLAIILLMATNGFSQSLPTPVGIRVPLRTNNVVRVEWQQPASVAYSSFNVRITPTAVIHDPETPSETSRTFSGLRPGIRYSVELVGVTEDGRRSVALRFHVWSVPPTPSGLILRPINEINIEIQFGEFERIYSTAVVGLKVAWDHVPDPASSALYEYRVQIQTKEGIQLFPQDMSTGETDITSRIYSGLTAGEAYNVSVQTKIGPPYDYVYSQPITKTTRI
uniref:Fibronectin type-III domain-containing protein n=1 Tax=Ciona savignyi TaxID=51511 RepID=H2ZN01_CIOSA